MDIKQLKQNIIAGDRRALAKGITLVESGRDQDRNLTHELLSGLSGTGSSMRIGISGVPGVGKSSFIETLGLHLVSHGKQVAVLAIDPTSPVSGGSLLGDKTRMETLVQSEKAFIRPSPTKGSLGGVGVATAQSIQLCEAAGFDVVIVETVGVGQSEHMVRDLVDHFLLLTLPNSGDELQGIKKGIMELADLIVVNKMDKNPTGAKLSKQQIENALGMITSVSKWDPRCVLCTALEADKVESVWEMVQEFFNHMDTNNTLQSQRQEQQYRWAAQMCKGFLVEAFEKDSAYQRLIEQVVQGSSKESLSLAAYNAISDWLKK